MPIEFDCIDCGVHVFQFVNLQFTPGSQANDDHVCAECAFIRTIEDPAEREALRRILQRMRDA